MWWEEDDILQPLASSLLLVTAEVPESRLQLPPGCTPQVFAAASLPLQDSPLSTFLFSIYTHPLGDC